MNSDSTIYSQWFGENNNSTINKEYGFHNIYVYT